VKKKKQEIKRIDKVKLAKIVGGLILPGELAKHAVSEGTKS